MCIFHSVIQGQFPPQAKPKIFNFSPKKFLPNQKKIRVPPPQLPRVFQTEKFSGGGQIFSPAQ